MPRAFSAVAWLGLGLVTACQGDILGGLSDSGQLPGSATGGTSTAGAPPVAGGATVPAGIDAGPRPLRRLTRVEYENTVADLLHLELDAGFESKLAVDARGESGFALAGPVGEVDAEQLLNAAESLAATAVSRGLTSLMGCSPDGAAEVSCVKQFIEAFGRRAFRRKLLTSEVSELEALFRNARDQLLLSPEESVALVLSATLQAPQFLYLWERTAADDSSTPLVALNPDELASRLSYLIWSSMPDAALFEAVDGGKLTTPEDLGREARRLLADVRAQDSVVEFVRAWFHLPNRADDALSSSATGETVLFVKSVLKSGGSLSSLLTSPTNFVNETLAPLYGASGVTGPELREMVVNPAQRFGLLTQVSFLGTNADGAQSHPVKRGAVILDQLLCGELPPVPANVPQPEPQKEGVSNRVRFAAHSQNACAVGCHRILDPLGFAFENYDGTGRYRTSDGGMPVDASGSVELPSGEHFEFQSAKQLVDQLATSTAARSCAAKQALRLALGRRELPADEGSLTAVTHAFTQADFDVSELLVAVATSASFSYRATSAP
jgi:hypothetical protein